MTSDSPVAEIIDPEIQRALTKLQGFLNNNRTFIGLARPEALGPGATKGEEVTLQAEHGAFHSLVQEGTWDAFTKSFELPLQRPNPRLSPFASCFAYGLKGKVADPSGRLGHVPVVSATRMRSCGIPTE